MSADEPRKVGFGQELSADDEKGRCLVRSCLLMKVPRVAYDL